MAEINFTLNQRTLAKGVGTALVKRAILKPNIAVKVQEEEALNNFDSDPAEGTSFLGTPVYGTMTIEEPQYSEFIFNKKLGVYQEKPKIFSPSNKTIGGKNYVYIEGCILEVSQPRNIVTTKISGQNGTDKEFINNGDYVVKLHGFFSTQSTDLYPEQDVKALREYITAPVPLVVQNKFLNTYFGITNLVVTDSSFKQVEGMRNVQHFTIDFISDVAFEAIEIDNV